MELAAPRMTCVPLDWGQHVVPIPTQTTHHTGHMYSVPVADNGGPVNRLHFKAVATSILVAGDALQTISILLLFYTMLLRLLQPQHWDHAHLAV